MSSLSVIEESELFKDLSQDVLKKIAAFSQEAEYPRGATIFLEEEARYLYVLEQGLVTLRIDVPGREERVMVTAIRDRGEVFGWSSLVKPYTYTAAAVCLEATKVIVVDGVKLMRLLEEDPESGFVVMKNVAAIIVSRLHKARAALTSALTPGLISHG